MSTVTYDTAPVAVGAAQVAPTRKPGFWSRVFDRMIEARMRQAEDYIARHRYLLTNTAPDRTRR